MTADITILTLTVGRPSLKNVEADIAQQTVQPKEWFVIEDTKMPAYRPIGLFGSARIFQSVAAAPLYFLRMTQALKKVTTKYVTFMDDDNRFSPEHIKVLSEGLKQYPLVATNRVYCNADFEEIGYEHPQSELVDTNNMALETALFRDAISFASANHVKVFADRHLQTYLMSLGMSFARINHATVKYRVADRNLKAFSGKQTLFETLGGLVLRS